MIDNYELVVPGPPPRKNERHDLTVINNRPTRYNSMRFKRFAVDLTIASGGAAHIGSRREFILSRAGMAAIDFGVWDLEIVAYWAQKSRKYPGVANADADAPISCVKDALPMAGLLDNDKRIKRVVASKAYDPHNPRTYLRLHRIDR